MNDEQHQPLDLYHIRSWQDSVPQEWHQIMHLVNMTSAVVACDSIGDIIGIVIDYLLESKYEEYFRMTHSPVDRDVIEIRKQLLKPSWRSWLNEVATNAVYLGQTTHINPHPRGIVVLEVLER